MDATADPASFVRFLERTSTAPGGDYPALDLLQLRDGQRCLDVGCGLGEDARAIARATGGLVFGIDHSVRLATEAARRSTGGRILFAAGEGAALPLPDSTFDAATIKRTLMHLSDPLPVIKEMARVVRPGGQVVAIEPDSEVLLLDSSLVDVTRRILAFRAAGYANPWSGRQLRGLLRAAGLTEIRVELRPFDLPSLDVAERRMHLLGVARAAAQNGIISAEDEEAWEADQEAREREHAFTCVLLMVFAVGRK